MNYKLNDKAGLEKYLQNEMMKKLETMIPEIEKLDNEAAVTTLWKDHCDKINTPAHMQEKTKEMLKFFKLS